MPVRLCQFGTSLLVSSRQTQIFIGVLGASNYTFAEATFLSQTVHDSLGPHIRMFKALGGDLDILVSDNLKSGV